MEHEDSDKLSLLSSGFTQLSSWRPEHTNKFQYALQLMEHDDIDKLFPADAIKRAKEYLEALAPGGTGAYTDSQGLQLCREQIAESMKERDGVDADPADIFMTSGNSLL